MSDPALIPTRQPLIAVDTPCPLAPKVVLYRDTLTGHVPLERRIGVPVVPITQRTLENPIAVCSGTTNPGYLVYVNQVDVSANSGHPFVVVVDPHGNPMPAVATVGFRRDYADLTKHTILWSSNG